MLSAILAFFNALPEILKLIQNIQKQIEAREVDRKVSDDLKKINEAFEKQDPKLLHDIFSN